MYELIGGHINDIQGGLPEVIGQWKGAVNVLLRPFPELSWLHNATQGRTVVRPFPDDSQNPDFNDPNMNPIVEAGVMVDRVLMVLGDYPCSHVQMTNEPAISSSDAMRRMSDFDAECSRRMKAHGRKITLANLGTGNPPNMAWWADYTPAIAQGMSDGAVLLVHAYTWPGVDNRWYLWRHRMIYEGCPEHGWIGLPKQLWIDLVIGEIGFDKGVKESGIYGGWRDLMGLQAYGIWLNQTNLELLKDSYCVGAASFCCGNLDWKWTGYDMWPEPAHQVAATATPVYRYRTIKPPIVNLVGTLPHDEYHRRSTKNITWTVSHHSGGTQGIIKNPIRHVEAINRFHRRKGWNGIAYTFAVDRQGVIYRCLRDSWVGYHCPTRNWNGRGILYMGNLLKAPPSSEQLQAGRALTRWLGKSCVDHRDVPKLTSCPGWDIC